MKTGNECAPKAATGQPLKPFVPMRVEFAEWALWCKEHAHGPSMQSVREIANSLFQARVLSLVERAREFSPPSVLPLRYVLVTTECIGQDKGNDVSHIAGVCQRLDGESKALPIANNLRIFHEHAVCLGSAYAVARGVECVFWVKDNRYGWI
jgi:hypothetical protein